jgi:hypothetical protein
LSVRVGMQRSSRSTSTLSVTDTETDQHYIADGRLDKFYLTETKSMDTSPTLTTLGALRSPWAWTGASISWLGPGCMRMGLWPSGNAVSAAQSNTFAAPVLPSMDALQLVPHCRSRRGVSLRMVNSSSPRPHTHRDR